MKLIELNNNQYLHQFTSASLKVIVISGTIIVCTTVAGVIGAGIGSIIPGAGTIAGLGAGLGVGAAVGAAISPVLAKYTGQVLESVWVINPLTSQPTASKLISNEVDFTSPTSHNRVITESTKAKNPGQNLSDEKSAGESHNEQAEDVNDNRRIPMNL